MDIDILYKKVLNGDSDAEEELCKQLYEAYTLLVEHKIQDANDARDLVQEVMTTIVQKYRHVAILTNFGAWAYGVFNNRLKRYYRDKKRKIRLNNEYRDMQRQSHAEPIDFELRRRLIECLKKLSQTNTRYAEVLDLHHQGFDTKEISKNMHITKNNVYNILFRARSMLKICIDKDEDREK